MSTAGSQAAALGLGTCAGGEKLNATHLLTNTKEDMLALALNCGGNAVDSVSSAFLMAPWKPSLCAGFILRRVFLFVLRGVPVAAS